MVMTSIGGRQYPLRSEPRCKVCNSPHRQWVEAELVRGSSYAAIAREVASMPHGRRPIPSRSSISTHAKQGHMPLSQDTQRRIIERRAQELGRDVDSGEEPTLADHVTVAQMIVQRGVEAVADGKLPLNASDVLKASAFLRQVEMSSSGQDDSQVWAEALSVYMQIAQQFIPPSQHQAYARALHSSPILRALAQRHLEGPSAEDALVVDEDVEDAEVEEEGPEQEEQQAPDPEPAPVQAAEPEPVSAPSRRGSTPPPEDW